MLALCFIHIRQYGRVTYGPKYFVTDKLGSDLFFDGDTSDLYAMVYEQFPHNEWDEIVCDDIQYYDDHIDITVSTYTADAL
jgi:hypothetical protein